MGLLNKKVPESLRLQLITLITAISLGLIYSFIFPIPTDSYGLSVGVGADILDIGDREFYINFQSEGYGYENIKGGILYPYILNLIKNFVGIFNLHETSKLWNIIVISITSLLSITNLIFIDRSAWAIGGLQTAKIANWLYVMCPYTLFYSLSGGLTMYVMFGTALCTYIISNASIINKNNKGISYTRTYILLLLGVIFLACLRPSSAIFGILVMLLFTIRVVIKLKSYKSSLNNAKIKLAIVITVISLLFSIIQLKEMHSYIGFAINSFTNERGSFFGVERQLLWERFSVESIGFVDLLKEKVYYVMWKLADFVSGLSDIRDTHSDLETRPIFPFMMRVITGIFVLYPINLFSAIGVVVFRKRFLDSGLMILLVASFISILPSLMGVAMSRYLIMVYPTIIISAACFLNILFKENF